MLKIYIRFLIKLEDLFAWLNWAVMYHEVGLQMKAEKKAQRGSPLGWND